MQTLVYVCQSTGNPLTDQYLDAQWHPLNSSKDSMIFSLSNTAKSITSDTDNLNKEYDRNISALEAKEYKGDTIRRISKGVSYPTQRPQSEKEDPTYSVNLPYVNGTSEKICRSMSKQNIRCTFYSLSLLLF